MLKVPLNLKPTYLPTDATCKYPSKHLTERQSSLIEWQKYTDHRGERASVCRLDPAPWHTLLCKLLSHIAVLQPPGCVANPTESVPAKSHGAIGTVKGLCGTVVPKDNRAGADLRFLGSSWEYSPPGPRLPFQLQVTASTRSVIDRRRRPLCRHLLSYFMHTPFPHRYIRREITYNTMSWIFNLPTAT